jgi:hypothetical protein
MQGARWANGPSHHLLAHDDRRRAHAPLPRAQARSAAAAADDTRASAAVGITKNTARIHARGGCAIARDDADHHRVRLSEIPDATLHAMAEAILVCRRFLHAAMKCLQREGFVTVEGPATL